MPENTEITDQCRQELEDALATSAQNTALLSRDRATVVAELEGKSTGALEQEFLVYSECSDKLRDFHMAARASFVDNHTSYKQMFTKIELLDQLAQFEFLGATPDDLDEYSIFWDVFLGTPGDIAGASASIAGLAYSGWRYSRINKLVKASKAAKAADAAKAAKAGTVANVADDGVAGALKAARLSKGMAVAGGVFSLAMAGFTIASAVKEERERHQALRDNLAKYADWYSETAENAKLFCYWSKSMRNEITELISNFAENPEEITDADFIAKLNGFMIKAGELDAQLRLATRMLCDGLDKSTVEGYTDLNNTILTYLETRINAVGSTACADAAAS